MDGSNILSLSISFYLTDGLFLFFFPPPLLSSPTGRLANKEVARRPGSRPRFSSSLARSFFFFLLSSSLLLRNVTELGQVSGQV